MKVIIMRPTECRENKAIANQAASFYSAFHKASKKGVIAKERISSEIEGDYKTSASIEASISKYLMADELCKIWLDNIHGAINEAISASEELATALIGFMDFVEGICFFDIASYFQHIYHEIHYIFLSWTDPSTQAKINNLLNWIPGNNSIGMDCCIIKLGIFGIILRRKL